MSNIKYPWFTPSDYKDIRIRKLEFAACVQFFNSILLFQLNSTPGLLPPPRPSPPELDLIKTRLSVLRINNPL